MAAPKPGGAAPKPDPIRVRFGPFELDEANASLSRDGAAVALPPTPFAVLCALARRRGTLISADDLLNEVWGHAFVSDSVLRTAISELRTALEDDARQPRYIQTVSRRGYRFIAEVSAAVAPPARSPIAPPPLRVDDSFIGREEPLARLHRAWESACRGERAIVWVAGDAGIGKTTLVDHFIASLGDVATARGQCVEHHGPGEPYLPVLEALSELARADRTVVELLRAAGPTWLLQLPWYTTAEERDLLQRQLAGVGPERMLREMGAVLDHLGDRRPLLLVTEDLHWSDPATIQLIDYVARRRSQAPLMWLSTFRLAEVVALDHPLARLRRELRVHRLCEEIVLDPFSERDVADYVVRRNPSLAVDEAFVRALHERTDGLPLFVASILGEMDARATQDGRALAAEQVAQMAVPEGLSAIIEHYVANLAANERTVLTAAAVVGVEFRVRTGATALGHEPGSVGDVCARLARAGLWLVLPRDERGRDVGRSYAFRHALFRQVLYECAPPSARTRLHREIGTALDSERGSDVTVGSAELAGHFERGGDADRALRHYAEAAQAALSQLRPAECLAITERATQLLPDAPAGNDRDSLEVTLRTLHGLAATRVIGAGDEAKRAFQRAYALLDEHAGHPMRNRLLHGFGFMLCLRAEYAEALAIADRAEALAAGDDNAALLSTACTVHGQVDQLQGRPAAAHAWLDRGISSVERLEVGPGEFLVDPICAMLSMQAIPLLELGLLAQARAGLQRASDRAEARGWPMARLIALWYGALLEVRLGNTERVAGLAGQMKALVDEFALAHGRAACRWFRGWADARMGDGAGGFRAIREAYELNARLGMISGASETLGYAAEALLLAGDVDGAEAQLRDALRHADDFGERVYLPQLYLLEAAIARARGDRGDAPARRALEEARGRESPWLELQVLVEIGRSSGASERDRRAMAALVERMPEAADTGTVLAARQLVASRRR